MKGILMSLLMIRLQRQLNRAAHFENYLKYSFTHAVKTFFVNAQFMLK